MQVLVEKMGLLGGIDKLFTSADTLGTMYNLPFQIISRIYDDQHAYNFHL